jgi:hypothetical protein
MLAWSPSCKRNAIEHLIYFNTPGLLLVPVPSLIDPHELVETPTE